MDGSITAGTQVALAPVGNNASHHQLWRLDSNSQLVRVLCDVVLSESLDESAAVYPSQETTLDSAGWAFQLWSMANGVITCSADGNVLTSQSNNSVSLQAPNSTESQQWVVTPTYPLTDILEQASVPLSQFSGDEATAYSSIERQLDISDDLRAVHQHSDTDH